METEKCKLREMALGRSGQVHCVPLGFLEPFGREFHQYFVSMDIFNYSVFMPIFSEFEMMSTYRLENSCAYARQKSSNVSLVLFDVSGVRK